MPKQISTTCRECRKFFGKKGKCPESKGLNMKTCRKFAKGRPFRPDFKGKVLNEIKFNPLEENAWIFWISDVTAMTMTWELDHNQYGHFRCFMIGVDDDGLITKQFTPRSKASAFLGEIVVKGPGQNDLWASYGHEDADQLDREGNVTNKPREVKLYPKRKD